MTSPIAKGDILISKPAFIGDPSFSRAVIYLTEHNADGTVGFILNQPMKLTLEKLVQDDLSQFELHRGGPVDLENLYFLHIIPDLIPSSLKVNNGIYWGGDFDSILDLLGNGLIGKDQIKFFLGYSGWSHGQLENEIEEGTWIKAENTLGADMLDQNSETIWRDAMRNLGGEYTIWANAPENPSYN